MFNHSSDICAKMYYYRIKIVINDKIEKANIRVIQLGSRKFIRQKITGYQLLRITNAR